MTKIFCDKCGKEITDDEKDGQLYLNFYEQETRKTSGDENIDMVLCYECTKKVAQLIKEMK